MENTTECERCGVRLRVDPLLNSDARMLRRAKVPKGLCINCAVHDFLRNTYPCNMLLAKGPGSLAYPHVQEQFASIMRAGMSDALPDEIGWELIIENWDLPFPHKVKPRATNPCSQLELDEIAEGKRPGLGDIPRDCARMDSPNYRTACNRAAPITSFEQINELEPGLGDKMKKWLGME